MRQAAVSNEPQVYQVWLNVAAATSGVGYLVQVFPERILLNGNANNAIQWQMLNGSLAFLQGTEDIDFGENADMFSMSFDPDQKIITARITSTNANETIYAYLLTVHLNEPEGMVIQVDPEVDNPPPPATGP